MVLRCCFCLACLFFSLEKNVRAQNEPVPEDTLMQYELGEIVIDAGTESTARRSVSTMQRVSLAGIAQADAASVDRVVRLIPAAHVQTNSRGETLVYLRNAGERQVALFFDGALLNVPWDNRVDLSLVPADVVGGITVAKGVPSVLYGTNVLGGALNLTSRTLENTGTFTQASGMFGSQGAVQGRLTHLGRTNRVGYTLSAGYTERDGFALPGDAELSFSQQDDDLRTNTDQQLLSLFGQVTYQFDGGVQLGLSLLRLDGEKGIAPESHVDPEASRVRFWRYPSWQTTMAILNGQVPLGDQGTVLRGAVWGSRFGQTISQFNSVAYQDRIEEQDDDDDTFGTRLTLLQPVGPGELSLALNALTARHRQQNLAFDVGVPVTPVEPVLSFRQHIWSGGVEYAWRPPGRLELLIGASLDGLATPGTGNKPARDPQIDFGVTSGLSYSLDDGWTLRASVGRKVRFPTMRELFGEALGRFLVNLDLKAESSLLAEAGLGLERAGVSGEVIAFINRTYDTIDQRSVQVPGEDRPRRQRVNLDGSRVAGVEVAGTARPARGWSINGNLTWTHVRAFNEDGTTVRLVEKPEWLGTVTLTRNHPSGVSALLQTVFTGRAYGLDDANVFVPLPTSVVLNARLAYLFVRGRFATEIFARVNNATDDLTLPQLGLPGPGRAFHVGLDVSF